MTRDIQTREDIDELMRVFYGEAISDQVIGYLFTEIAKMDLEQHLPIIGDFWESVLFGSDRYRRHGHSPLMVHAHLNRLSPLEPHHFDRWLDIFTRSVDSLFVGPRSEFIKIRAYGIAQRMMSFIATTGAPTG